MKREFKQVWYPGFTCFGVGRSETESPCSRLVILVELCGDFLYSWPSMVVIEGVGDAISWLCSILGQEIL